MTQSALPFLCVPCYVRVDLSKVLRVFLCQWSSSDCPSAIHGVINSSTASATTVNNDNSNSSNVFNSTDSDSKQKKHTIANIFAAVECWLPNVSCKNLFSVC